MPLLSTYALQTLFTMMLWCLLLKALPVPIIVTGSYWLHLDLLVGTLWSTKLFLEYHLHVLCNLIIPNKAGNYCLHLWNVYHVCVSKVCTELRKRAFTSLHTFKKILYDLVIEPVIYLFYVFLFMNFDIFINWPVFIFLLMVYSLLLFYQFYLIFLITSAVLILDYSLYVLSILCLCFLTSVFYVLLLSGPRQSCKISAVTFLVK